MHMLFTLKIGMVPTIRLLLGFATPPLLLFTWNLGDKIQPIFQIWYILGSQYSRFDGTRNDNLMVALYQLRQEPSERIMTFHNHLHFHQDQFTVSKPIIKTLLEVKVVSADCERVQLHQFLMGICHGFELVCIQLLHLTLFPLINIEVNEQVREEVLLLSPHFTRFLCPWYLLLIPLSLLLIQTSQCLLALPNLR